MIGISSYFKSGIYNFLTFKFMKDLNKEKRWYVRLFTLGKVFKARTFFDNLKKYSIEFFGFFLVVTFSFYVESVGEDFQRKNDYYSLVEMMSNDADSLLVYTKNKAEVLEYITDEYQDLYDTWDSGKKTQFVWIYDKDDYDFPLQMFSNRDPFVFQSKGYTNFEKGNQEFYLVDPETSNVIEELFGGFSIQYIKLNSDKEEEVFTRKFNDRVENKWIKDLGNIDLKSLEFWTKNSEYIRNDRVMKYNLYKRIELWKETLFQYRQFIQTIESFNSYLKSAINDYRQEKYFLYWKIN